MNVYQVAVQQLYEFRDHYFEHNSTDKALLKNQETQEKLKETLNILDYVQGKKSFTLHVEDNSGSITIKLSSLIYSNKPDYKREEFNLIGFAPTKG